MMISLRARQTRPRPAGIVLLLLVLNGSSWQTALGQPSGRALLVGCTHYEHIKDHDLKGPINDVREMSKVLIDRFGFSKDRVRTLTGWPDEENLRPTRANILRELKSLVEAAEPGSQVVIYLSGHGTRVPIPETQTDLLDPKNPEFDGMDEAFVAADAHFSDGGVRNLILDNELGDLLEALRAKGAHVWAVFDCCHSGTMARGASDETPRELDTKSLGVPEGVVRRAEARAEQQAQSNKTSTDGRLKPPVARTLESLLDSNTASDRPGSLVAFYAAQPFETAPDLPCPPTAKKSDSNFFGLLTYTTLQTIHQQLNSTKGMTYRELGQLIRSRYRAERGSGGPTPTFVGDVDREVLGLRNWPGRSRIVLQQYAGLWYVNAGELSGLTLGTVLEVRRDQSTAAKPHVVGYVCVKDLSPTSAEIEPCAFRDAPAIASADLEDGMYVAVISQKPADLRIRLAASPIQNGINALQEMAHAAVHSVQTTHSDFVDVCDAGNLNTGDWLLCTVTPEEARVRYRLALAEPHILLARVGSPLTDESAMPTKGAEPAAGVPVQIYRSYLPKSPDEFRASLESDLLKIFTWQNLWRIAGRMGATLSDPKCDVKVTLAELAGPADRSGGQPLTKAAAWAGQTLELRVRNDSTDRLWVTLIFLDSTFRIHVWPAQGLNRPGDEGDALEPIRFEVTSRQPGIQAWLVIASSAEVDLEQPDFAFLSQRGLGDQLKRVEPADRGATTPFAALVQSVAGRNAAFRGGLPIGSNPTLMIRSWVSIPQKSAQVR